MFYEWDEAKAEYNRRKHGVAFENVHRFDFELALQTVDDRRDYGEQRIIAYAPIEGRLHALVYVLRTDVIRVVSLRRANDRERQAYEQRQR